MKQFWIHRKRGQRRCARLKIFGLLIIAICCFVSSSHSALIPPFFTSAVVAIGSDQVIQEPGAAPRTRWVTEGTGFLYGYLVHDDDDRTKKQYVVFLVTAGHVIRGHMASGQQSIRVRLGALESSSQPQEFEIGLSEWFFDSDPNIDLAAAPISIDFLRERALQSSFYISDGTTATKTQLKQIGASAGDGVFILGFPMSLTGEQRNYVIVRQGAVARISELLDGASRTFLVDSFVFPGNSGGPVILKPEIVSIEGTKANSKAWLIGVVIAYQPYTEVAVSIQTRRPRVIFEENSGLAIVLPMDYVNDLVRGKAEATWNARETKPPAANP